MSKEVITYINENLYGIWFLIGAALVFWMQAGFAMVETANAIADTLIEYVEE